MSDNVPPPGKRFLTMRLILPILLILTLCSGCAPKASSKLQYRGKPIRYWETLAENDDPAKRVDAARALGKIGPRGLPALTKMMGDKEHRVRAAAYLAIMDMKGKKVVPELQELIDGSDQAARDGATKALVQIYVNRGEKGVPKLIELLKDPHVTVRVQAVRAFVRVDRDSVKTAIPAIKEALGDGDPTVRKAAQLTLAILVPPRSRVPAIKR
jgi:HEAT repeat protein